MLVNKTFNKDFVKTVQCKHPGCTEQFSTSNRKEQYCENHKKTKYTYEKTVDINNLIIKHDIKERTKITCNCELCDKEFEILLLPNTFVYPKYCESHRSEHKRKMFLLTQTK